MSKDNGGPAFPFETSREYFHGMTLRDYFAAKAMQAFAEKAKKGPDTVYMNYPIAAREAYAIADAMLAERAK